MKNLTAPALFSIFFFMFISCGKQISSEYTKSSQLALNSQKLASVYAKWADSYDLDKRGLSDDPDGDGFSNFVEFCIEGSDPLKSERSFVSIKIVSDENNKSYAVSEIKANRNALRFCKIMFQKTSDLKAWVAAETFYNSANNSYFVKESTDSKTKYFYRANISSFDTKDH